MCVQCARNVSHPLTAPPMEFHVRDLHSNLTLCGNDRKMKLELKKQFPVPGFMFSKPKRSTSLAEHYKRHCRKKLRSLAVMPCTISVSACLEIYRDYEIIYELNAIEYLFVYYQLDMFRAYTPVFRSNGC